MDAYRILVERHKDYAFTIANRIVSHSEEAEEVIQDAFVKVYRSADSFKGDAKFTTWFYRVVFNTAVSSKRKKRVVTSPIEDYSTPFGGVDQQDELSSENRKEFLQQALEGLPDEDKLLLTLFYFKEFSLEEISEVMSIEKGNIKVKLFRARKKLANELNGILKGEATSLL